MTLFFVHLRNAEFHSCDEGAEYDRAEDALSAGVRSAVALLADEIGRGERSAAIEVSIQRENGTELLRSVVVISVSSLLSTIA